MGKDSKEKLEQELRFLKESFDAEVISREEYEKGRERIEKKLQGNENNDSHNNAEPTESQKPEKKETEPIAESKIQIKAEAITEAKKDAEAKQQPETAEQKKEGKKESKAFKYAVVFVVLVLVVFFGYSLLKQNNGIGKEEAKQVQFTGIKKIKVNVLNDRKNCFNCETERVLWIIESWFGDLDTKEIDYNTEEGKSLTDKFGITTLPTYLFEADITNKSIYSQIKQAFISKNGNYILSDNAAASTFYFRRENIPNRLDFFAKEDASGIKAEKNLNEFLAIFPNVGFEKHSSTSNLAKELGIKTFPTFLINNRIKFTGIYPPETIKDNFCSLNKLPACKKELSQSLI